MSAPGRATRHSGAGEFVTRCSCGWTRRFSSPERADAAVTWHRQSARHDFWKDGHKTMMSRAPITASKLERGCCCGHVFKLHHMLSLGGKCTATGCTCPRFVAAEVEP